VGAASAAVFGAFGKSGQAFATLSSARARAFTIQCRVWKSTASMSWLKGMH
jgi:hypothetical protein